MLEQETEKFKLQMLKYQLAEEVLLSSIKGLVQEYELVHSYNPIEHIKSRIKSRDSIVEKLKKRNYEITLCNILKYIHDVVGVRIVCSFLSDVYNVIEVLENSEQFEIIEKQDYIRSPKKTGYMSYHMLVKVPIYLNEGKEFVEAEIQIRTVAMDFWASLDHKLLYKFSGKIPKRVRDEVYQCSLDVKKLDGRMLELNEIVRNFENR